MEKLKIQTDQLIIRHLEETDLTDFHCYRSNPEVTKYQGFDVMDERQATQFIRDNAHRFFGTPGEWVQYAIENTKNNRLIGDCAIKLDIHDKRIAEVGLTISHLEHRKGFGKEALLGILKFLFDVKKLHRIVEIVDAKNTASIKLLESIGFKREGHFIENRFFKGHWCCEYQYAMLQREWIANKSK